MEVQLYVYDLSGGLIKQFSRSLFQKQIDAIYHTSIVVWGTEYYFGQGICFCKPGQSHHGQPIEIVNMGTTQIPSAVFEEYLESLSQIYTADKYHLLQNNCNHFTNELCQFLLGKNIPSYISGLPEEFLSTALGQQLLPMINAQFASTNRLPVRSVEPKKVYQHKQGDMEKVMKKCNELCKKNIENMSFAELGQLIQNMKVEDLFPVFDYLRLKILKKEVYNNLIASKRITNFLDNHFKHQLPNNLLLMLFRLLTNCLFWDDRLLETARNFLGFYLSKLQEVSTESLEWDERTSFSFVTLLYNYSFIVNRYDMTQLEQMEESLLELISNLLQFCSILKPLNQSFELEVFRHQNFHLDSNGWTFLLNSLNLLLFCKLNSVQELGQILMPEILTNWNLNKILSVPQKSEHSEIVTESKQLIRHFLSQ